MKLPLHKLHAITDERIARRADFETIASRLDTGAQERLTFHARGRALSGLELFELARRLGETCPRARVFVNDRLDIALAVRAQGVQLRTDSLAPSDARRLNPHWWIGVSVHDLDHAAAAQAAGADYLLVGPVFPTATHPEREPLGVAALAEIVKLGVPVVAIGGVTPERIPELRAAGAHGVAAIRALWDAADPADAARRMVQELQG